MSDLQHQESTDLAPTKRAAKEAARKAHKGGLSPATLKAYEGCWRRFEEWASARGYEARPARPEVVATYLQYRRSQDDLTADTLIQYASAIRWAHRQKRLEDPTEADEVSGYLAEVSREDETRSKNEARPLRPAQLKRVVRKCGAGPKGLRDRAIFLVGFVGALRRSELAALQLSDVEERPGGYVLTVRTQKNKSEPQPKGIPRTGNDPSAAAALGRWLSLLSEKGIESGPVFRSVTRYGEVTGGLSSGGIGYLFGKRIEEAGLSTSDFSPHSLRAGFLTTAAEEGASLPDIQRQSGHEDSDSAMGYIRDGEALHNPAVVSVGL